MNTIFLCVSLVERFSQVNVLVGLGLAMVGFALSILAKKITIFKRKEDTIDDNDKLYIFLKALGLVILLVSLIILIIE